MTNTTRPDVLIIGDSHSLALIDGCQQAGLTVDGLWFSGTLWHRGSFGYGRKGLMLKNNPSGLRNLRALTERMGTQPFAAGVPVIASVGYHLGRLVPPFGTAGHVADPADPRPDVLRVSERMLEDYIHHYRGRHLHFLKMLSRRAKLVVIPPPPAHDRLNYAPFRDAITRMLRRSGVTVLDPADTLVPPGQRVLPPEMVEPDGTHGNGLYGLRIAQALIAQGFLAPQPGNDAPA